MRSYPIYHWGAVDEPLLHFRNPFSLGRASCGHCVAEARPRCRGPAAEARGRAVACSRRAHRRKGRAPHSDDQAPPPRRREARNVGIHSGARTIDLLSAAALC